MPDHHQNPDDASERGPDDFDGIPDLDPYIALEEIGNCLDRLAGVPHDSLTAMRRGICVAAGELFAVCEEAGVPVTSAAPEQVPPPLLTHLIIQTAPEQVVALARRRAAGEPGDDFHTVASWIASVTAVGDR